MLNLVSLTSYPPASCDEAWYADSANQLLNTGRFGLSNLNNLSGTGQNFIAYGRLFLTGEALFISVLGPTLFAARLYSVVGSVALAASVYLLGRLVYGQREGVWSAHLVLLSWSVFSQSHTGRPDIWMAAGATLGLYLAIRLTRHPSFKRAILTGVVVALLEDVHLNGLHFILATSVLVTVELLRQRAGKALLGYVLGGLLGAAYFVVLHLYPDPAAAIHQYRTLISGMSYSAWADVSPGVRLADLLRWLFHNFILSKTYLASVETAYYLVGLGAAIFRRDRASLWLVGYVGISWFSFTMTNIFKPDYYAVLWKPALTLLAVRGVLWLIDEQIPMLYRRCQGSRVRYVAQGALGALLLAYSLGDVYLAYKFRAEDYDALTADLRALIPEGARAMGEMTWWFGLQAQREYFNDDLVRLQRLVHDPAAEVAVFVESTLASLNPTYVIYDTLYTCSVDPSPESDALLAQIQQYCEDVGVVRSPWHAPNTVYRCDFPAG